MKTWNNELLFEDKSIIESIRVFSEFIIYGEKKKQIDYFEVAVNKRCFDQISLVMHWNDF